MDLILNWILVISIICILPNEAESRKTLPFRDLTVSIHHSIPQDERLISTLETLLTEASKLYHRSVQPLGLFETIHVVVPNTWNLQASGISNNLEDISDIRIEDYHRENKHNIQRVLSGECGQHGEYISIGSEFVNSNRAHFSVGNTTSILLHQLIRYLSYPTGVRTKSGMRHQDIDCHGQSGHQKEIEKLKENPSLKSSKEFKPPKYKILKAEPGNVYLFLLDLSNQLWNESTTLLQMMNQLKVFVKNHIPIGSYVGFVTFAENVKVLTNVTLIEEDMDWNDFFQRFATEELGSTENLSAGVDKCVEEIKRRHLATLGARFILLTDSENNLSQANTTNQGLLDVLTNHGIVLHTFMLSTPHHHHRKQLQIISQETRGLFYVIDDERNVFEQGMLAILSSMVPENRIVKLQKKVVFAPSLHIDSLLSHSQIYVGQNTTETLANKVQLVNPENLFVPSVYINELSTNGFQQLKFETNQTGGFRLQFSEEEMDLNLQVISRSTGSSHITAWLSHKMHLHYLDVRIFAQIKSSNRLHHLNMTAQVTIPSGKVIHVHLQDNGLGADVVHRDGIYSGFFTDFRGKGKYTCFAKATGLQKIRNKTSEMEHFQRYAYAGVFWNHDKSLTVDKIPPAAIRDLMVTNQSKDGHIISLNWTAVGDNLDHGKVAMYELRITVAHHWSNFGKWYRIIPSNVMSGSLDPLPAGKTQYVTFAIPNKMLGHKPKDLHIAIKSHDHRSNPSEISNIETVHLKELPLKINSHETSNHPKDRTTTIKSESSESAVITKSTKELSSTTKQPTLLSSSYDYIHENTTSPSEQERSDLVSEITQVNNSTSNTVGQNTNLESSSFIRSDTNAHSSGVVTSTVHFLKHKPVFQDKKASASTRVTEAMTDELLSSTENKRTSRSGTLKHEQTEVGNVPPTSQYSFEREKTEGNETFHIFLLEDGGNSSWLLKSPGKVMDIDENGGQVQSANVHVKTSTIVASWVAGIVSTFFVMAIVAAIVKNRRRSNVYNVPKSEEDFMESLALKEAAV